LDFRQERRRSPPTLDLTSLIDVVFILLLFFVVTTTFQQEREEGLPVDLPRSSQGVAIPEGEDVRIAVAADGSITVDGAPATIESLSASLRDRARRDGATLVVVSADSRVDHGRVVQVMDLARGLGLTRFAIAVEGDE
jgi:biopolymer transport protein ExbD